MIVRKTRKLYNINISKEVFIMWKRLLRGAIAAGTIAAIAYLGAKDDQVLCSTPEVYFAITGFDQDETGFYAFVKCRNKTGRKMIFRCVRPSVLGCSVPIDFTQEVGPHETVTGSFWINIEFMKLCGIRSVDELSFWLEAEEAATGKVLISSRYSLAPTGKMNSQLSYPVKIHTETERVFADNEMFSFTVLGWRITDTGSFAVDVLTKNRTNEVLRTEWTDILVNGKLPKNMIEFEQIMDPGIMSLSSLSLYGDFFRDSGLKLCQGEDGIQDITFNFRAFKGNSKTPVFEKQIVWTAPAEADGLDPK